MFRTVSLFLIIILVAFVVGCLDADSTGAFTPKTQLSVSAGVFGSSAKLLHTKNAKIEARGMKFNPETKLFELDHVLIEDMSTPVIEAQAMRMKAMEGIYDREIELQRQLGQNAQSIILASVLGGGDAISKILGTGLGPLAGMNFGGPGGVTTGQIPTFAPLWNGRSALPEAKGACCIKRGTIPPLCVVISAVDCQSAGGKYFGDGSSCENTECPDDA